MVKILVTGGAGYIGTSLIPKLLSDGYEVTVFDNLMVGGNQLLPFFRHNNFKFVRGDIRKKDELQDAVNGQDVIIHLAALVGFPVCRMNPNLAEEINVDGTVNLINCCTDDQVIFYGSTGSNYGSVKDICSEDTPLHPLSLYGVTKTKSEKLLMERKNTIAYRFATAFGVSPRFRLDLLINDFSYKCIKDGYLVVYEKNYMRTFIHVVDIAECFMFGIRNMDKMMGNVFNVGDDEMNHSKEEVCNMIGSKTGAFIHFEEIGEDADQRNYVVSYDKISKLGFRTTISVEQGIDEVINALSVTDFQNKYTNARYY